MLNLCFSKYVGCGNDFILIDNRLQTFDPGLVPKLCHRHTGIGADGVILLQNDQMADFRMVYFNRDGSEASRCGNGLRCFMQFVRDLGVRKKQIEIRAGEEILRGEYLEDKISIDMGASGPIQKHIIDEMDVYSINTGVPHAVVFSKEFERARLIRQHKLFEPAGTNVNFALFSEKTVIDVRTFERGVEAETLACGTGALAVATVASELQQVKGPFLIRFPGGNIEIAFHQNGASMIGEAKFVFSGVVRNIWVG